MADERGELERELWARFERGYTGQQIGDLILVRRAAELLGECRRAMRRVHDELAAAAADVRKAYDPNPSMWLAGRANGLRGVLAKLEGGSADGD